VKLPLRDLERLRQDPTAAGQPRGFFPRFSKNRALHLAVYRYHREGNNLPRAIAYFEDLYLRNFKRTHELDQWLDQLTTYADMYEALGTVTVEAGRRASIVHGAVELTGEISRLDLDLSPGGEYAVWLFTRAPEAWKNELRMPLIQQHFATKMGVASNCVSVGIYDFDTAMYDRHCFSDLELERASNSLTQLAAAISATTEE
jgi:hypothetical protein